MESGREKLSQIVKELAGCRLRYRDSVIVGDNSSGKSELLKGLILELNRSQKIYFIDAVNRVFDTKEISYTAELPVYKESVLKTRLDPKYFNLLDSFDFYGTKVERIEQIYNLFEDEVQRLFCELTGNTFELIEGDVFGEVRFSEGTGLLSSGYQAIIRILLEVLYFKENLSEIQKDEMVWIIIDELDEFLSPRFSGRIMGFLKEKFPEFCFVISTHSCDLVMNSEDANLIILDQKGYEVWDINDYDSMSSVQIIFNRVFGQNEEKEDEIFVVLRTLLSKKINGAWSQKEEEQLEYLGKSSLTASQKVIYKQIVEW